MNLYKWLLVMTTVAITTFGAADDFNIGVKSMSIVGETRYENPETLQTENFLVSGRNATITITFDENYKPQWGPYTINDNIQVRHTLKRIDVIGVPITEGKYCIVFSVFFERTGEGEAYSIVDIQNNSGVCGNPNMDLSSYDPVIDDRTYCFRVRFPMGNNGVFHGRYAWTVDFEYTQETKYSWGYQQNIDLQWGSLIVDYETPAISRRYFSPNFEAPFYVGVGEWYAYSPYNCLELAAYMPENNTNEGCVFFDKYGMDSGNVPNWFEYWREDGACPGLAKHKNEIVFDPELPFGAYGMERNGIVHLGAYCAEAHYPNGYTFTNKNYPGMSYSFGGPDVYGIYTVEENIAHELQHKYTRERYDESVPTHADSDKDEEYVLTNVGKIKVDEEFINFFIYKIWHYKHEGENYEEYYYCDHIVDDDENTSEYKLDSNFLDTYFVQQKHWQYKAYGDDEFLAMIAANKASERTVEEGGADPSKDWAIPGEQSYLPKEVIDARVAKANAQLETKELVSPQSFTLKKSSIAPVAYSEDGFVESFGIDLDIESDTGGGAFYLSGILYAQSGEVAAYAFAVANGGEEQVELRFSGRKIRSKGSEGPYSLKEIKLYEYNGCESTECGSFVNIDLPDFDFRISQMDSVGASLIREATDLATDNGIEVTTLLDVVKEGQYNIAATLSTTNDEKIAMASGLFSCTTGLNRVSLVFDSNTIGKSYLEGPYKISYIQLNGEMGFIQGINDFYVLQDTYKYDDFGLIVTFDSNGSYDYMPGQAFVKGLPFALNISVLSKENYSFAGWATTPDGPVVYSDGETVSFDADITLYAVWTPVETKKRPDIGFATFSNWNYGYGMFTVLYDGDLDIYSSAPTTLFNSEDVFYIVNGYGNFGDGANDSDIVIRRELIYETGDVVFSNESAYAETFEPGMGLQRGFASLDWTNLTAGVYCARVTLDPYNSIGDTNRANNTRTFMFAIKDAVSLNEALGSDDLIFTAVNDEWYGTLDGDSRDLAYARTKHLGNSSTNIVSTCVSGVGRISFYWYVSSEQDYDRLTFFVDGVAIRSISGQRSEYYEVAVGDGNHKLEWRYEKDDFYYDNLDCALLANVVWSPKASDPAIEGDAAAEVSGNARQGYFITPEKTTKVVVVVIPDNIDAKKVTVIVSPGVEKVKANGARIKVVQEGYDITDYLGLAQLDNGSIDVANAELKEDMVFAEVNEGDNEANIEAVLNAVMNENATYSEVKSAKPGLFYSMEASNEIGFPDDAAKTKSGGATMATSGTVTVAKPEKPAGDAVFYRIKVSKTVE